MTWLILLKDLLVAFCTSKFHSRKWECVVTSSLIPASEGWNIVQKLEVPVGNCGGFLLAVSFLYMESVDGTSQNDPDLVGKYCHLGVLLYLP